MTLLEIMDILKTLPWYKVLYISVGSFLLTIFKCWGFFAGAAVMACIVKAMED